MSLLLMGAGTVGTTPYSLSFNGTNGNSLAFANDPLVATNADFSIALWVLMTGNTSGGCILANNGFDVGLNADDGASSTKVTFDHWNTAPTRFRAIETTANGGAWHHYIATFNAATGGMILYKDGASDGTNTLTGTPKNNTGWRMGAVAGSRFTAMLADEVMAWNRLLSPAEAAAVYAGSPSTTGLVCNLTLNEGTGTTAADSSGGGHAGTITGATWSTNVHA
jgi:hypothetical protein